MRSPAAALLLSVSLLSIPFAGPISADQVEDADASRQRGNDSALYRLIQPLAEDGDALAQYNLCLLYQQGAEVPQDNTMAAKWCRRAAEQGDALAQYNLGAMYFQGEGVPQDDVLAHMWSNIAASRFPATDAEERKLAEQSRNSTASRMTPAQIADAQRLAREWKSKEER